MAIELRNANIKTMQEAAIRLANGEVFIYYGNMIKFEPGSNTKTPFRIFINGQNSPLDSEFHDYHNWHVEVEIEDEWPKLRMVRNNDQEPCKLAMVVSYENGLGFKTDDGKYYTQCAAPTKAILYKYL